MMKRDALIEGNYRYCLTREWDNGTGILGIHYT